MNDSRRAFLINDRSEFRNNFVGKKLFVLLRKCEANERVVRMGKKWERKVFIKIAAGAAVIEYRLRASPILTSTMEGPQKRLSMRLSVFIFYQKFRRNFQKGVSVSPIWYNNGNCTPPPFCSEPVLVKISRKIYYIAWSAVEKANQITHFWGIWNSVVGEWSRASILDE